MKIRKILSLALIGQLFMGAIIVNAQTLTKTENVILNVTSENTLELKLSTNSINFTGYNGTQDSLKDLDVIVDSSLDYNVNVKMNDELKDTALDKIIDKSNLSLWENGKELSAISFTDLNIYKPLVTDGMAGRDRTHNVNVKLKGDSSVVKGNYETVLTFQAVQK